VIEILPAGRIVLSLRGYNLVAETRGVTVGCGQTLDLLVRDVTDKIELQWVSQQDSRTTKHVRISNLTLPRLLGMLSRLREILRNLTPTEPIRELGEAANCLRHRAQQGPVFLPKAAEFKHENLIPGEVVTSEGGLPALLRSNNAWQDIEKRETGEDTTWFEMCLETHSHGPVAFVIYRSDGKLRCKLQVLDSAIPHYGKTIETLQSELEKLGYQSAEVDVTGLNRGYPDILRLLDRVSEESINFRI